MNEFFINNHIWFLVIGVVLIFALIGFIIDSKKGKLFTEESVEEAKEKENLETITASNMTLGDALKKEVPAPELEPVKLKTESDIQEDTEFTMMVDEPDK